MLKKGLKRVEMGFLAKNMGKPHKNVKIGFFGFLGPFLHVKRGQKGRFRDFGFFGKKRVSGGSVLGWFWGVPGRYFWG